MKSSKIEKNVIVSFGGQLIVLILGIFLPRIVIVNYGSDTNGLLSTITQIFTYMGLLEAGVGQAARNALYRPLAAGDSNEVSHIASIASNYYRKMTMYYGIGVLILSVILPFLLKSNINKIVILGVVLFEGLSGVVSFYFIQLPSTVFLADGKGYINNSIVYINKIIGYGVKLFMAAFCINIVIMQFVFFLITIAKVFVYQSYFKRNYPWIKLGQSSKTEKLKDRNSFILTEVAWTLFSSTDMIVLSMFISTEMSSVYGVYNLVFSNLNVLLTVVYTSINYVLGITFFKSIKDYEKVHDAFVTVFMSIITILMSVSYIMIFPFINLYMRGVTDVEYIYPLLPLLFCLVQLLSWSRYVPGNLTGIAGYAKQTSIISLIEAICNIVLSIVLVNRFSIQGVLLATVISLPLKVIYCNYIADKKIMNRSVTRTITILGINFILFFVVVFVNRYLHISVDSYLKFFIYCIGIFIIMTLIVIPINFILNPKTFLIMKHIRGER